jgi:hypothetical protein
MRLAQMNNTQTAELVKSNHDFTEINFSAFNLTPPIKSDILSPDGAVAKW